MPVYMIRAGESGPVKIGHSLDPQARLAALQIAHYERLRIIRLLVGGEAEESMLHLRFADQHLRGEWHSFSRLMLGDVGIPDFKENHTLVPSTNALPETTVTFDEILFLLGGASAVAARLGCVPSAVSNWKRDGVPAFRMFDLLEMATEINPMSSLSLEEIRAACRAMPRKAATA